MPDEEDEEIIDEFEVTYIPRPEVLEELGITVDEFEAALMIALEELEELAGRDDVSDEDVPMLEEVLLDIKRVEYKLEDLAEITVEGDLDLGSD